MSNLPNATNNTKPLGPKNYSVRGKNGRFTKTSQSAQSTPVVSDTNIPVNTPVSTVPSNLPPTPTTGGAAKELQPGLEQVYLEEAERTKELKEQLAELEKEAEVKEIKGEIELPEMVKKEGVEVIGEGTPIPTQTKVVLPLDDTKVYHIVKSFKKLHQNVKDSVTWLAFWCYRQLQLLHIKLKEVHGKITRQPT